MNTMNHFFSPTLVIKMFYIPKFTEKIAILTEYLVSRL